MREKLTVNTVKDLKRILEDLPEELTIMTHYDGNYYPINEVSICSVIADTDWTESRCYTEVDEGYHGRKKVSKIFLID